MNVIINRATNIDESFIFDVLRKFVDQTFLFNKTTFFQDSFYIIKSRGTDENRNSLEMSNITEDCKFPLIHLQSNILKKKNNKSENNNIAKSEENYQTFLAKFRAQKVYTGREIGSIKDNLMENEREKEQLEENSSKTLFVIKMLVENLTSQLTNGPFE